MRMRLEICIDANDIELMADFWCEALGYQRHGSFDGVYQNLWPRAPQKVPVVFLQKVAELKTVKDRLHLDIYSTDMPAKLKTLLAHGASKLEAGSDGSFKWQVLQDPEGNEFCVMQESAATRPKPPNVL